MKIKLAGLVGDSIVDGPGLRFTIFTQGCPHHCEGCHNPQTHDFEAGRYADCDKIIEAVHRNPLTSGITFSGGEPFCQPEPCAYLAKRFREQGFHLLAFTGFTFEQLQKMSAENPAVGEFLGLLDVIIDSRFDITKRSLELRFKGSSNQRTLDVQESLKQGRAVEIEI